MIKKGSFCFILGPCLIEDMGHALRHATFLRKVSDELHVPIIYKSSYLKDNRTSGKSPRGPGLTADSRNILRDVRKILPVITDVHSLGDLEHWLGEEDNGHYFPSDLIQIPAMLSRQTSLLESAGYCARQILIKKMTTMSVDDIYHAAEKVGRKDTVLCERGTAIGYHTNIIDYQNVANMVASPYPVAVDVTHPARAPHFALPLAKAACALKVDAIFAECHEMPHNAPSDGARMLSLSEIEPFIEACLKVRHA